MKPKGFIHTLVLVLVASALIMPSTGCFGDYKGISRNDDQVFGAVFGGFWGVGLVFGLLIQYGPFWYIDDVRLTVGDDLESRDLQVAQEGSGLTYVDEHDLTLVLAHDDVNDVTFELAIPGKESGRFTLPAGELDAPWGAIEINGTRYVTSENAQLVVEVKRDANEFTGIFNGRMQAEDGTLHDVSGVITAMP